MKKVVSVFLIIAMLAMMLPSVCLATSAEDTTTNDFTIITTAEQLKGISGKTGNYVLGNDIDFKDTTVDTAITLSGILDGAGHTIFNFKLPETGNSIGLFAHGGNLTVRNLNVGKPDARIAVNSTVADAKVGVLFASNDSNYDLTFENVDVYADVTANNNAHVGGFVGYSNGYAITFTSCSMNGSVKNENNDDAHGASGFIGTLKGNTTATYTRCINNANITAKASAGGLGGFTQSSGWIHITNCINNGNISAVDNSAGLLGYTFQLTYHLPVNGVWNTGNVATGDVADKKPGFALGGLFARTRSDNTFTSLLQNMFVQGTVFAQSKDEWDAKTGAIFGYNDATVKIQKNCIVATTDTVFSGCANKGPVSDDGFATSFYYGTYVNYNGVGGDNYKETNKLADMKAVVDKLNSGDFMADFRKVYGDFKLDADGNVTRVTVVPEDPEIETVCVAPTFRATQETTKTEDNKQAVRFLATLDTLDYNTIGFRITAKYTVDGAEKTVLVDQSCKYVYNTIIATESGSVTTVSARDLGGEYIYCLVIEEVPTNLAIEFTVTPYAIGTDGTEYVGIPSTVTYQNGAPVNDAQ